MNLTGNMRNCIKSLLVLITLCLASPVFCQSTISGFVYNNETGAPMPSVKVVVVGTYNGAITKDDGSFVVNNVKIGEFTIKAFYAGFATYIYGGFKVNAGDNVLIIKMSEKTSSIDVTVYGTAALYNLQDPDTKYKLNLEDIKQMNAVDVKDLAALNPGVVQTPDGLQLRGGRVYEAQYVVDGANAQDPLAGTGFGVDVGSNAVDNLTVTTGGVDAEFGDGSSGVIQANIREGGNKLTTSGSYQRDNFGTKNKTGWNTDIFNFNLGTPIPYTKNKLSLFTSVQMNITDHYFGSQAKQLHSSLLKSNDSFWAPRYDNSWSNTLKISYKLSKDIKITFTNVHSLGISQNTRALQIIGSDNIVTPGFQFPYSLNLDNATTYTHQSNLSVLNYTQLFNDKWSGSATASRLFTNLRADANGRPFRDASVDRIYDPASIVTDPISIYNPEDSVIYVNPGPGLINNNGLSEVWHDHYAQELTIKAKVNYNPSNQYHAYTFGFEHKEQEYQWIDVFKPWIGAPIRINDSVTTLSSSIGRSNDVWKVNPASGGFFAQDNITYKGISAIFGARLNYWAPGTFADDAVGNPNAPVLQTTREDYLRKSVKMPDGRRYKARLLPKLRVSFPVTDNNVLYFNYGHSMRLPHPRFVYAGLDPVFQDRSFLSNLGNPDLDPEVTVSYELGIKSQINRDFAFTLTAFYNDKFDYIVARTATIKDNQGRFVEKTFFINQDYARIRGIETSITRRIGRSFKAILNGSYQIATGKSNTALESRQQIIQNGFVSTSKENYLAWDRPLDLKFIMIITPDTTFLKFNKDKSMKLTGPASWLKGFRVYYTMSYKSGLRYSPFVQNGVSPTGRPIYEIVPNKPFSKLGTPWFTSDLRLTKDFKFGDRRFIALSIEVRNVFNANNAQIINPVTGQAYSQGDPLPYDQRDPTYQHPQDGGTPPNNPARYLAPRQILYGISYQF
ncbi:MAG: TonB-dependent receptor [Bacteroidota bacterium]|nr:TonB-dependent receptor [Bacteroidota bacterium]